MNAREKVEMIKSRKMSAEENINVFLREIEKNDKTGKKINAFLELNENALEEAKEVDAKIKHGEKVGKLAGLAIAVKSNINVKGMHASCASLTLKEYKCGYDASVIKRIREEGGVIIGMVNMDEFACGSSGETSAFGPTRNPVSVEHIPGGSSSGSVAAVAAGFCDLALGSDTGGSIRNPASHCGVVGMKPSYGAVSRYGLIDLSMSLDQIGPIAKDVESARLLYDVIKGIDERDATTYGKSLLKNDKTDKLNIGIIETELGDKRIREIVERKVKEVCEKNRWLMKRVKMKYDHLAVQAYYPLVYVEFFSATRRLDGRRYGKKIEEVAGQEVLRRIFGGSEISKAEYAGLYYRRALKAKELIKKEYEKVFEKFDCLIMPTVPRLPHKIGERIDVKDMYAYDAFTIPANLAEVCAISVPCLRIENMPVGLQIVCKKFDEARMFNIAERFECVGR